MTGSRFFGVGATIAILFEVCLVASARPAQAGINAWTSHGPTGGDVQALAIDPKNPTTLYAGTERGVFKSTDGGDSWTAGGGICHDGSGTLTVANSTFSGNSAGFGGGIRNVSGQLTVSNTIVVNSPSGGNCDGSVTDGGHNLQWPGTDCGEMIPSLDPLLDPAGLQDNGGATQTIALLPDSPAIDAGDPSVCAKPPVNGVDQRGYVRPGTGATTCSIGAYEYNSSGPPVSCLGDCAGDGRIGVDELVMGVNIALGNFAMSECPTFDSNSDHQVTVDEIVIAVNAALNGCGS